MEFIDRVQPNISPTISFSGMYKNHLFIVVIGPVLNKDMEFFIGLIALILRTLIVRYHNILYGKI